VISLCAAVIHSTQCHGGTDQIITSANSGSTVQLSEDERTKAREETFVRSTHLRYMYATYWRPATDYDQNHLCTV